MRKLKYLLILILAVITLPSAISYNSADSPISINGKVELGVSKDVRAVVFKQLIDANKSILLDVRTKKEFVAGHIKGAINIDWYRRDFEVEILRLDKNKQILIYCHSGNRTSKAKFTMIGMGFQNIINLQYGINDWAQSGFTFVK